MRQKAILSQYVNVKAKHGVAFCLLAVALQSCVTTPSPSSQDINALRFPEKAVKQQVSINCTNDALCTMLKSALDENRNLILVDAPAGIHIDADLSAQNIATLQTKPTFFGKLTKQILPVELVANYTIQDNAGTVIKKSKASVDTETKAHIAPQTMPQLTTLPTSAWTQLSAKLNNDIAVALNETAWQTPVTAHAPDKLHFSVAATDKTGLMPTNMMTDLETGTQRYQVVAFERDRTGAQRAILKPMEGFPPAIGTRLTTVSR